MTSASFAPLRITAVCLGNICRSPMAEVLLRARLEQAGIEQVLVDSAGTGGWHVGKAADPRAERTLRAHGYDIDHRARQFDRAWFDPTHPLHPGLIVAMDTDNYRDLQRMAPHGAEIRMFRGFDPRLAHVDEPDEELSVPDPYYGGVEGFTVVLEMLESAADGLIEHLEGQH